MNRVLRDGELLFIDTNEACVLRLEESCDKQGICKIVIKGIVNSENVQEISDELDAILSVGNGLELDMERLTYITPEFSEKLVRVQCRLENSKFGTMPIYNINPCVLEQLKKHRCLSSLDYEIKGETQ